MFGESFVYYNTPIEMTGLKTMYQWREDRCLSFSLKCLKHPVHKNLFPVNPTLHGNPDYLRQREPFAVIFAYTDTYRISALPYCQRLLNSHFSEKMTKTKSWCYVIFWLGLPAKTKRHHYSTAIILLWMITSWEVYYSNLDNKHLLIDWLIEYMSWVLHTANWMVRWFRQHFW